MSNDILMYVIVLACIIFTLHELYQIHHRFCLVVLCVDLSLFRGCRFNEIKYRVLTASRIFGGRAYTSIPI